MAPRKAPASKSTDTKKAKTAAKPAAKASAKPVAAVAKPASRTRSKAAPKSKEAVSDDDDEDGEDEKKENGSEDDDEEVVMTFKEFKAAVKNLKVVIGQAKGKDGLIDCEAQPKEFSTG